MSDRYERLTVRSREEWRTWLTVHHGTSRGVWLVTFKKASGQPHVSVGDLVDEALAHGWADSRPRKLDDERSARLITPRKPSSNWSRVNKQRAERLIEYGLMAPAGLAAIDAAKASGTWSALDAVEDLTEPDDLRDALNADATARAFWDAFRRSTKRAILEWIAAAKRPETRAKRVAETARLAEQDVRANQWRQPKRERDR